MHDDCDNRGGACAECRTDPTGRAAAEARMAELVVRLGPDVTPADFANLALACVDQAGFSPQVLFEVEKVLICRLPPGLGRRWRLAGSPPGTPPFRDE